jgi:peroxiredoxin
MKVRRIGLMALGLLLAAGSVPARAQESKVLDALKVGATVTDVELQPLESDETIKLSELTAEGPVVLVVLRGWPGYQCPICFRQMGELLRQADTIQELGAKVVLVYPGPADNLSEHAKDFLKSTELPAPFLFVVDPDYALTNTYQLRWDEPRETAYPSTFVLDLDRVIKFRKISFSHGDRAKTDDVIEVLRTM